MVERLVRKEYWDGKWKYREVKIGLDFRNYSLRRFHEFFSARLPPTPGLSFLEIGCAGSTWLRYFAEIFGYRVNGLDYSEVGCQQAREILARHGISGEIYCLDFFAETSALEGRFDVLFSYGFIEHFDDPVAVLARARRLCRPGAHILTVIPNLHGLPGAIQRWADRTVYDLHRPLDAAGMAAAHEAAGFATVAARYVGSVASSTLVFPERPWTWRAARKALKLATKGCWALFDLTGWRPESRALSPYVVYVGRAAEAP